MIEAVLHVGVPLEEILVTGCQPWLQSAHFGFELAQVRRRAPRMLPDGPSGVGEHLLLEEADARAPGERDIPRIRRLETRRDPQERRLADAVWANETNAVTVCEAERNVAEDQPLAEPFRDRLDREDAHGIRGSQRGTLSRYDRYSSPNVRSSDGSSHRITKRCQITARAAR